jgi:Fe-S cluster assembly protein SufB
MNTVATLVDQEYTLSTVEALVTQEYKWGFVTDIEAETVPRGLNEDIVCRISAKKHEPA